MQKITEIKEYYTVNRREKVDGEVRFVPKTKMRYKEVPYVSGWARFGHFMLDRVFFIIFTLLFYVTLGLILGLTNNAHLIEDLHLEDYEIFYNWLILHPLFYFIFELSLQGSPAKALLGRVVVDEYGNKPTVKQFFIRSISRSVPFEPFSCFSETGWHDNWSGTFVIRKKDLAELRLLQKINDIGAPDQGEQKDDSN